MGNSENTNETPTQQPLIGAVAMTTLAEWREKYGQIWVVEVEGRIAYFRKPDRSELRAAMVYTEKDKVKYMEILVEACMLGGATDIKTDDDLFFATSRVIPHLTSVKHAEIKKL